VISRKGGRSFFFFFGLEGKIKREQGPGDVSFPSLSTVNTSEKKERGRRGKESIPFETEKGNSADFIFSIRRGGRGRLSVRHQGGGTGERRVGSTHFISMKKRRREGEEILMSPFETEWTGRKGERKRLKTPSGGKRKKGRPVTVLAVVLGGGNIEKGGWWVLRS